MSTHNICFYGEITKIIRKLSSNTLLFCSTVLFMGIRRSLCKGNLLLSLPYIRRRKFKIAVIILKFEH